MNNIIGYKRLALCILVPGFLAIIPGCDFFGSKKAESSISEESEGGLSIANDGSTVLFTMDGKPVITESMVARELENLKSQTPEARAMIEQMGDQFQCLLVNQFLVPDVIITRYLTETGARDTQEYKKKWKEKSREFDREWFGTTLDSKVTDSDLRKYYNEHKESLVLSQGGRKTKSVQFKDKAKAESFLAAVKDAKGDIEAAAKDCDLDVKDYGLVHAMSIGIDSKLREKIMAGKVPSTELIAIDSDYFVVRISQEEPAKYHAFEDIKEQLREMVGQRKMMEVASERIETLRKKYNIVPVDGSDKYSNGMKGLEGLGLDSESNESGDMGDEELPAMPLEI